MESHSDEFSYDLGFEVQDLAVASLLHQSCRNGIRGRTDLGWRPFVTSWLNRLFENEAEEMV